jgi:chemosensory pili system protein ChpA (sensor histidine kinase/response regulator)
MNTGAPMLAAPSPRTAKSQPEFLPSVNRHNLVLVADDHADSRAIARIMMELAGMGVIEAATGIDAVRLAVRRRPSVIILDMRMPGLDGWGAATQIRRDARTRDIPIVGFSACARASDRERALAAGCDVYLTKPMAPKALLEVVRHYAKAGR